MVNRIYGSDDKLRSETSTIQDDARGSKQNKKIFASCPAFFPTSAFFFLLSCFLHTASAVDDGAIEPPSSTKWCYGWCAIVFVYVIMPFWGREGFDYVWAYIICYVVIGCWVLRGIAN